MTTDVTTPSCTEQLNNIGRLYLREFFHRHELVRKARRAYHDVDGRRRNAAEQKHEAMDALIDREQELEQWLVAVGIDIDHEIYPYA